MEAGEIVAGKYRVDRVMGRGGMGMVVAADHLQLQQRVALKVLIPEIAREPALVERFMREARASAQLRSEHVCRISDVGALNDGSPYIVMELLDGQDLATVIKTHGALPVPIAVDYVLQACVGIAEAHALGVVHRDLKPANLFLTRRPDGTALVKVLDFGIAKSQRQSEIAAQLTQTQAVLGSPGYMSPEQLRASRSVDVRSDVWSLGVILYELVSGMRPFTGDTITEIALRVTLDPPPPLPVAMAPGFAEVVLRCLEKDPASRFPHLGALASALAEFGRDPAREHAASVARVLNVPERVAGPPAPTVVSLAASTPVPVTVLPTVLPVVPAARPSVRSPRMRWRVLAIVAGCLALAIVNAIVVSGGSSEPSVAIPSPPLAPAPSKLAVPEPAVQPAPIALPPPSPPREPAKVPKPRVTHGRGKPVTAKPAIPVRPKPPEDLGASRF